MPILRADMSVDLRRSVVGSDDFDENVLEILFVMLIAKLRESNFSPKALSRSFVMLIAKLRESAFGEKFAGLDDADGVAELFDFGHDVRGENDGFAVSLDRKSTRLNSSHATLS